MDNWHHWSLGTLCNIIEKYIYNSSPARFPENCTYSNIIKFGRKCSIARESYCKKREKDIYKERG